MAKLCYNNKLYKFLNAIKQLEAEQNEQVKKKDRKAEQETVTYGLLYKCESKIINGISILIFI